MTARNTALGTFAPIYNHAIGQLARALARDANWSARFSCAMSNKGALGLHIGVFVQPYLDYLLQGKKTVESRFSSVRCAPFKCVSQGDLVLLKLSGGPIVGIAEIEHVWSYELDPSSWKDIRRHFTQSLCAQDPAFWESRKHASFATLMKIARVSRLPPTFWPKRDRRGWVVIKPNDNASITYQEKLAFK